MALSGQRGGQDHPVLADPAAIREAIARAAANFDPNSVAKVEETHLAEREESDVVEISAEDMGRVNPQNPNHSAEELMHWPCLPRSGAAPATSTLRSFTT